MERKTASQFSEIDAPPENAAAFVMAMRNSGARSFFLPFYEVLRFHALTDCSAPGGKNFALNVYMNLSEWGAFVPVRHEITVDVGAEIDRYVCDRYLHAVGALDKTTCSSRLQQYIDDLGQDRSGETEWIRLAVSAFPFVQRAGHADSLHQWLRQYPLEAQLLHAALGAIIGLAVLEKQINIPTTFDRYTAIMNSTGAPDEVEQISSFLAPFFASDDISEIMHFRRSGPGEISVTFYSSTEAARAWAQSDATVRVVDSREVQIG